TKTKRQVCPLQPPSKVTNRHYSFGFAKISTLSKTHGTRYQVPHTFLEKERDEKHRAVLLQRSTPARDEKFLVVYFCN
ncbi:MAG TPA: hypothetical protein O0X91_03225, partial [Methanocorpusculum sp.]|nr:hypothetical protein [Methanocorpusculum sp.]